MIYVDDLIAGILALLRSDLAGPVNIGNPHETSVLHLAETIKALTGSTSDIVFIDRPVDDPTVRQPDITLARTRLGWSPTVGFEDGLERTLRWFKEHPGVKSALPVESPYPPLQRRSQVECPLTARPGGCPAVGRNTDDPSPLARSTTVHGAARRKGVVVLARDEEWTSPPQSWAGASARQEMRSLPTKAEPCLGLGPPGRYQRWVKPVMDRLLAGILLIATLPLIVAAALAVLLALGRPVILRQDRVGLGGEVFTIRKFRTMRPCRRSFEERRTRALEDIPAQRRPRSETDRRQRHKHPHDPRLVKVGHFLRKWSLDELPQLYNVVHGDMSLVGPRPELPYIVRGYEEWQHQRHLVKPGITGLWQVSDRGQDDALMHHRTDVDLDYVRELSLWLDVKLLLLTVPAALGVRRGI